jgi:hypothetical protein
MRRFGITLAALAATAVACSSEKPAAPAPAPSVQPAEPARPPPVAAPAAEPAPAAAPAPAQVAAPAPAAKPAPGAATPVKAAEPAKVVEPAKPPPAPAPTAAPAAAGHATVGAEKCKLCHRLQYDSWAASPHQAKGLDCEGCHGGGADYKAMGVMKDRAAAIAAGLVLPGPSFCKKCHASPDAALVAKVHAHKAR